MLREADDQPSVNVPLRADPIVHYTIKSTVNGHGLEDVNVAGKDRAARLWCENAATLTGTAWAYLKVRQEEYNILQPTLFADLIALDVASHARR